MDFSTVAVPSRGVVIAATPLGNVGDASVRLMRALEVADVIAAEDTRRTRALAAALGVTIRGQVVSNFDHNEDARVDWLVQRAKSGMVLVVSDAGMPVVSDPGRSVVAAAREAGVEVTCLPGPSAVPTALALSGLGVGHFAFDGFAPRKQGARRAWLEKVKGEQRAVVFFESPHRIAQTLADVAQICGAERRVAVARELTKTYEQVRVGTAAEVAQWAAQGVKGEITVVVDAAPASSGDPAEVVDVVLERVAAGARLKDACKQVAAEAGVSVKQLYDAALQARDAQE